MLPEVSCLRHLGLDPDREIEIETELSINLIDIVKAPQDLNSNYDHDVNNSKNLASKPSSHPNDITIPSDSQISFNFSTEKLIA